MTIKKKMLEIAIKTTFSHLVLNRLCIKALLTTILGSHLRQTMLVTVQGFKSYRASDGYKST